MTAILLSYETYASRGVVQEQMISGEEMHMATGQVVDSQWPYLVVGHLC